jgi:protein-S-isoprenylcysteine O-methyltransferase Ste14
MMLLYLAVAFAANSLWMLLLVWPTGSALCLAVIRKEEDYLQRKFGDQYALYRQQVRRWI